MDPINPIAGNPEALNTTAVPSVQKSSSKVSIIIFSILTLILLGSTGYLYYQNQQLKTILAGYQTISSPTPSATSDPTANWKTYTNDTYGFSFKYPTNATYKTTNYTGSKFGVTFNNLTKSANTDLTIYVGNSWYFTNPNADTTKNFTIGGIQAYREDLPLGQNPPQTIIYVKSNNNFITIQLVKDPSDNSINQIFDQILSSFSFTTAAITEKQAAAMVAALPEVKDYLAKVPNGKIVFSSEDTINHAWIIHVYEDFPDHTATFAFYSVDETTGNITKR